MQFPTCGATHFRKNGRVRSGTASSVLALVLESEGCELGTNNPQMKMLFGDCCSCICSALL